MEKKKVLKILKIIGVVIGLFVILYFVSQNLFFDILATITVVGVPLISIAITLSPLWITKHLYKVNSFTVRSVLTAIPLIVLFTFIVWKLDVLFLKWIVSQVGKALLQSF